MELSQFRHFDLLWLKELSFHETKMLNTFIRSFLTHMPNMLTELREATQEQSFDKVSKAIRNVSSVASLFTQKDYGNSFLIMHNKEEQLSQHTIEKVNSIVKELEVLQMEVAHYHYQQLESTHQSNRLAHSHP